MPLPTRKWYSLDQAAEKISEEFNKNINSSDVIHFFNQNLLRLYVYIYFEKVKEDKFVFNIKTNDKLDYYWGALIINTNINKINEIKINEVEIVMDKNKCLKNNLKDFKEKFSNLPYMEKEDFEKILTIINKETPVYIGMLNNNEESDIDYIIQTRIRKIKGFFSIKNENEFGFIDEYDPKVYFQDLSFNYIEENEIKFNFTINFIEQLSYQELHLKKSSLFVTSTELARFIKENNGLLNRNEKKLKNENFSNQNRKKDGRPQHPLKSEVIAIAQATFSAYNGDITRQKLAEELAEYINNKHRYSIKQRIFSTISEETIRNYLKELNIGNRKGKSKNLTFTDTTKQR